MNPLTKGMDKVWNNHIQYYQIEWIEKPDVHAFFFADLRKTLGDLWDVSHHGVLGMDTNDDVGESAVSAALAEIDIEEAFINI